MEQQDDDESASQDPALEAERQEAERLTAETAAAIAACGGDATATVRALIVANRYLEAELELLAEAVSRGFTRGQGRARLPVPPRAGEG